MPQQFGPHVIKSNVFVWPFLQALSQRASHTPIEMPINQPKSPKVQVGWLEPGGHLLPLTDGAKDKKKDNCLSVKGVSVY